MATLKHNDPVCNRLLRTPRYRSRWPRTELGPLFATSRDAGVMANRLASETSPYLRQHADNPVDWWPWCGEAFEEAKQRNVPVLVSIGYSACHWCHVMAHESFEDPTVAEQMNRQFVCIKIDREERPDIDAVYMEATQALTGSGGWPMTVFMDHRRRPFFCGTYFPPHPGHGRPAFTQVMDALSSAWNERRDEVVEQAAQITKHLAEGAELPPGGTTTRPTMAVLDAATVALARNYDAEYGGFSDAPKFPVPSRLEVLFHRQARQHSPQVTQMLTHTLNAMAAGGIYDHIGGGFARYSTEVTWLVPHFEKMLYDQAGLLRSYLRGWQLAGAADHGSGASKPAWEHVITEIVEYVHRDLGQLWGGVSSAEDADSPDEHGHGVEGLFYTWTVEELRDVLGADADVATDWWGCTVHGNFERRNILHRPLGKPLLRPDAVSQVRDRLFDARQQRRRPGLDDKVLTEWNAMWISSLAEAGAALGRSEWVERAAGHAEFLLANLRGRSPDGTDGRWLRSWQRQGGAHQLGLAADHAWLVDAFTRLYEASGRIRWLSLAAETAEILLKRFADPDDGCVWTVADDGEQLIIRQKQCQDGATPSANSVAAVALLRLGAITGDERWTTAGANIVDAMGPWLAKAPTAFTYAVCATDLLVGGITEVVISGDRPDLVEVAHRVFRPDKVLVWGEQFGSPLWEGRYEQGDDGQAYVCRNQVCEAPISSAPELLAALSN